VLGRDGRFHVLVRMGTRVFAVSAPWDKAQSAQAWSEPRPVSAPGGYYTALAVDSKNTLHALWSEAIVDDPAKPNKVCPNCSDMYYRRSSDGGTIWSAPVNLSRTADGENRPQIVIDGQDRIHAVWDLGVDWYAGKGVPKVGVYRRSDDGGQTWSEPTQFGFDGDAVQQMSITLTADGNPFVVYRSVNTSTIYFQTSPDGGQTWSAPARIPGVLARSINDNNLDRYSLVLDSANHIHLVLAGFVDGDTSVHTNPWLLHLVWDGQAWSAPGIILQSEQYPEWPQMIVAGGNQLHVVWFTRNKDDMFQSDRGAHYQVWYSSMQVAAPAVTPQPFFTPVPTVAATTTPQPFVPPTPTPLPATSRDASAVNGPPTWEAPGLALVSMALLPVLGLLAFVVGITVWIRRR
jgi:hypothetical protein